MFGLQNMCTIWSDHNSFTRSVSALQMTHRAKRAYSQNGFELSFCYSTEQLGRVPSGCINEKISQNEQSSVSYCIHTQVNEICLFVHSKFETIETHEGSSPHISTQMKVGNCRTTQLQKQRRKEDAGERNVGPSQVFQESHASESAGI